jgi:hypothetical protein
MSDIPTSSTQPEFVALIGIDWGDKKHAWALQAGNATKIEKGDIEHTPEAIQLWAAELRQRFPTGRLAVALEQSRGPLVFALSKYEHLTLFPIHPTSAAEYRKIFRPSGAKSDGPGRRLAFGHAGSASGQTAALESGHTGNACVATANGGSASIGQ